MSFLCTKAPDGSPSYRDKAVNSLRRSSPIICYLISEFFPLPWVHSNHIASSLFLEHMSGTFLPQGLCTWFYGSFLKCSSAVYLLCLGLCSNVTYQKRPSLTILNKITFSTPLHCFTIFHSTYVNLILCICMHKSITVSHVSSMRGGTSGLLL